MKKNPNEITIDNLFDNRLEIGNKLLAIMKSKGHTKLSFSKLTDISRPTLNNLFKGETDSKTTFKTHINKITEAINITLEEIFKYNEKKIVESSVYFSDNSPEEHCYSSKANDMFNVLDCILDLCELYY